MFIIPGQSKKDNIIARHFFFHEDLRTALRAKDWPIARLDLNSLEF